MSRVSRTNMYDRCAILTFHTGVFGGIIVGQDFIEYFNHPSPAMQGFVTSVYDLGCFVGAIVTLFVGEKLGRRWTMLLFTVIMGSGIIFQTASHNMTQMVRSACSFIECRS